MVALSPQELSIDPRIQKVLTKYLSLTDYRWRMWGGGAGLCKGLEACPIPGPGYELRTQLGSGPREESEPLTSAHTQGWLCQRSQWSEEPQALIRVTAQSRLWAPSPDIIPGDRGRVNAPTVNNASSVTCQAQAASNKVSLGQGRRLHLCLRTPLSTREWKMGGSLGVRAFFISGSCCPPCGYSWKLSMGVVLAGVGGPGAEQGLLI